MRAHQKAVEQSPAAADFTKQGDIEVWQGKDTSGNFPKLIDAVQRVTPERQGHLPRAARQLPISSGSRWSRTLRSRTRDGCLSVDVVWTAEFAAKGYVEALPPDLDTTGHLKPTVNAATYFEKLYACPSTTDGGLLYYRKDLLDKYSLEAPTRSTR